MNSTKKPKLKQTDFTSEFLDSATFDQSKFPRSWLVEQILLRGRPAVIGGPKKCLKTSLAVDMAISLGSGTPFLDTFRVPNTVRVAVMSGESGLAAIQDTARRICDKKKVRLKDCNVLWSSHLPRLTSKPDRLGLKSYLRQNKVEVVVIDPLYLCLFSGSKGQSASNLFEVGPILRLAGQACLSAGATPILIHHATKGKDKMVRRPEPLNLDDLAFAGIAEYMRQWLLLNRREPYRTKTGESRVLMAVGGSDGHSGCWEVDVNEGVLNKFLKGRKWEVGVGPYEGTDDEDEED